MLADFWVSTDRRDATMVVGCGGELDVATCPRLEEALAFALEDDLDQLVFDGRALTILTSAGITSLFELARSCKERDIRLVLKLSRPARRVLDLVGLWWLGVVDDGFAVEDALGDALKAYADLSEQRARGIAAD